jgi:putative addiction module killer protein
MTRLAVGNFGDYKHIENGIYELRFITKSGFRIYYFQENNKIIILLNGGNKSSRQRDITKAKEYFVDYLTIKEKIINEKI